MTVDREQVRRDAEGIYDSPDLYRIHGFAGDCLALLAELEQAEARLAKAPALVEAMRYLAKYGYEGDGTAQIAIDALEAWDAA